MVTLMNGAAYFLQGEVLTAAQVVEAADGRVSVAPPEQKYAMVLPTDCLPIEWVGIPAFFRQSTEHVIFVADEHEVNRVAAFRARGRWSCNMASFPKGHEVRRD